MGKCACDCVCHGSRRGYETPHPGKRCVCNGGAGYELTLTPQNPVRSVPKPIFTPLDVPPKKPAQESPETQEKKVAGRHKGSLSKYSWYDAPIYIEPSKVRRGSDKTWVPKSAPLVPELFEFSGLESNVKTWVEEELLNGLIDGAEFRWAGRLKTHHQQLQIGVPKEIVISQKSEIPTQKIPYEVFVTLTSAQVALLQSSGFEIQTEPAPEPEVSDSPYSVEEWREFLRKAVLDAVKIPV